MLHDIKRGAAAAAVLLASALAVTSAHATTLIPFNTEDLSHLADVIVVAEIENVRMVRESDRSIRTHNAARVVEVWKSDVKVGDVLDVVEPGGLVDGKGFDVEGTAGYLTKEKVVLFLERRKDGRSFLTIGMYQGKLTVLSNGNSATHVTRHIVKLDERGRRFDAKKIAPVKIGEPLDITDLGALATHVKGVVESDRKAGIHGKDLPKYKGMGR